MAVDLSPIDESLLAEIANIHGMPKGAFNIRKDGELVERHSSANIEIATKTDNPGIDIRIKAGTKGEDVYKRQRERRSAWWANRAAAKPP